MSSLPRSTPEAQGSSAAALATFASALDASEQEIQTLMLVRHGQVVLEAEWAPYRLSGPHLLFSISKSFTSMPSTPVPSGRKSAALRLLSRGGSGRSRRSGRTPSPC